MRPAVARVEPADDPSAATQQLDSEPLAVADDVCGRLGCLRCYGLGQSADFASLSVGPHVPPRLAPMLAAARAGRRLLSSTPGQSATLLHCPSLRATPWWDGGGGDGGGADEIDEAPALRRRGGGEAQLLAALRAALEPVAEEIAAEYERLVARCPPVPQAGYGVAPALLPGGSADAAAAAAFAARGSEGGGGWGGLYLWNQGLEDRANLASCPATAAALSALGGGVLLRGCSLGFAFFSVLRPGTVIRPHCGSTNLRLRAHLALRVPPKPPLPPPPPALTTAACTVAAVAAPPRMRVGLVGGGGGWREWEQGKVAVFDDSFEHEVVYPPQPAAAADGLVGAQQQQQQLQPPPGGQERVVLLVDLWHPEVTSEERALLCRLFPTD